MHGPAERLLNIGEAARASGLSPRMIRHYEKIGLLPASTRSDSGYRRFAARDLAALRFIRHARRLGFEVPQIAELMGLWNDSGRTSREVKDVAERQLDDLRTRLRDLRAVEQALLDLVDACRGDDAPHCAILDRLAGDGATSPWPERSPRARAMGAPHKRVVAAPRPAARNAAAATAPPAEDLDEALRAWTRTRPDGPA